MTVLVSFSVLISSIGVVKRAADDSLFLAAQAGMQTSQSVLDQTWSAAQLSKAADRVVDGDAFSVPGVDLSLNQGIVLDDRLLSFDSSSHGQLLELYEKSAELTMFDLQPDEMISGVAIDLCRSGENCPEIFFEWFRFDRSFRFQDLEGFHEKSFDRDLQDYCVDLEEYGVQRCLYRSSSYFQPNGFEILPADGEYSYRWRLATDVLNYDYVLRLWGQSSDPFWMRFSGLFSFPDGELEALPQQLYQAQSEARAGLTRQRATETRRLSAGLQDIYGFVHFADEVEDK